MKVQSSHYFLGPLVRDSSLSLSLSFAVHGTKGADLPLFIAAMVRQTSCERGGPTLGVDGEFKQSHFLPSSHREDSLGLVSADSVTRPTSRTVLSLSPSSLSLLTGRAIMTPLDGRWMSTKTAHLDCPILREEKDRDKDVVVSCSLNTWNNNLFKIIISKVSSMYIYIGNIYR